MEELSIRVRTFVYTMICFQCLMQISVGNSFYKYLKLFSQLLALCICCNIVFSFIGVVEDGWRQADGIYEKWQEQWYDEAFISGIDGELDKQITQDSVKIFEQQIIAILQKEGNDNYELAELSWQDTKWKMVIRERQSQGNDDFGERFKKIICQEFTLKEEQLEVKIQ